MTIFEQLTSNIILHPNQGYAFYYYNNKEEIEEVNGSDDNRNHKNNGEKRCGYELVL